MDARSSSPSSSKDSIEKFNTDAVTSIPGEGVISELSSPRKYSILLIVCTAQFLGIFGANAVIISLPSIGSDLDFSAGNLQWMLTSYTLTNASAMLISGTISDIFHPKPVFCIGFAVVGLLSIPIAKSVHPIMSIVLRSAQGLGAAMSTPSSVSMLRATFPKPAEQGRAYGALNTFATIGNVLGFVLGGLMTATASWRWVFYTMALIATPTSILAWFIIPAHLNQQTPKAERRRIDFLGVFTATAGLSLFIYALSAGTDLGWKSPRVIACLTLSVLLCGAFFLVEGIVKDPAVPPKTWSNKNFLPLFFYGMSTIWWVFGSELQLIEVFMMLWRDSSLKAAIRCLPMGIAGISAFLVGALVMKFHHWVFMIGGQVLMAVASVLFALTVRPSQYWHYAVPGMIIGMVGLAAARVIATTMMMLGARKGDEGIVAALSVTAAQLGTTVGVASLSSITISVNNKQPLDDISRHRGYEASFWSLLALNGIMIFVALFVRR